MFAIVCKENELGKLDESKKIDHEESKVVFRELFSKSPSQANFPVNCIFLVRL